MSAASASSCYFIYLFIFMPSNVPPPPPIPSQGRKQHMSGVPAVFLCARSPFEMATYELQRVMVGRRHAEHQTLQPIHFVHVVRHLCRGDSDTCHISAESHSVCIYFTRENLIDIHQVLSHEPISNLDERDYHLSQALCNEAKTG